ncbi:MAG: LVIVD repeat-containing protein [Saprospiraceae bacterium]
MKSLLFLLLPIGLLLSSCSKDLTRVEVTYTKATALYGDLNEIRSTPLIGEVQEVINPGKIFTSADVLLVGEEGKGIHVIDNSNPENPVPTSFINIPFNREFFVRNNIVYAESHYDMVKIDISNLQQPTLVDRVENAFAQEFADNDGRTLIGFDFERVTEELDPDDNIYNLITAGEQEFFYFDFNQRLIPESAVPSSFAGSSNSSVGSVNRITYYKEHVYVVSRSELSTFSDAGKFELLNKNQTGWDMETVFPHQDRLFVGTRQSVDIYDLADLSNPQQAGSFWHATSCDPVYPDGDVAYVTLRTGDISNCPGDENALVVLDINDIQFPQSIQEITMESPYGITLIGDRLFVGEGANGLKIFDASDRRNIALIKHDKNIEAYDVIAHPTRSDMVLIAGPNGLGQYEVQGGTDLGLVSQIDF